MMMKLRSAYNKTKNSIFARHQVQVLLYPMKHLPATIKKEEKIIVPYSEHCQRGEMREQKNCFRFRSVVTFVYSSIKLLATLSHAERKSGENSERTKATFKKTPPRWIRERNNFWVLIRVAWKTISSFIRRHASWANIQYSSLWYSFLLSAHRVIGPVMVRSPKTFFGRSWYDKIRQPRVASNFNYRITHTASNPLPTAAHFWSGRKRDTRGYFYFHASSQMKSWSAKWI